MKCLLKLLTKPAEGTSHTSALLKGANAVAAETQCLPQMQSPADLFLKSHKNIENTDCVTGPHLEIQDYV